MGCTKGRDKKIPNRNKFIATAVDKQVSKTLSAAINATEAEASNNYPTDDQARAYIMSHLNDTKAETTPAKPILKKVTLKSILGNIKTPPK